ncbi:Ba161.1 [Baboon cytomegalovirus]|nr:Ba161.1 [Baboon cytomegalovirus]
MRTYVICFLMCICLIGTLGEQRCQCINSYYPRIPRTITCIYIQHPGPTCHRTEAIAYFNPTYHGPICLDYNKLQNRLPKQQGSWCRFNRTLIDTPVRDCRNCDKFRIL